jgi:hypothetical protein
MFAREKRRQYVGMSADNGSSPFPIPVTLSVLIWDSYYDNNELALKVSFSILILVSLFDSPDVGTFIYSSSSILNSTSDAGDHL